MPDETPLFTSASLPLTPSAFLEALAARLDRLHEADTAPVLLRGIPVRPAGIPRIYGGFVYAEVRDPHSNDTLAARVPERLAAGLEWGREAVLVGLLRLTARQGQLRPEFRVDAVHAAEGGRQLLTKDELLQRWAAASARPKRDARAALEGDRPRVVVITGVGSVAVDDVRSQLREAEADLVLDVVRVPMDRPAEVAKALRQATDARVVVLTRGGGQGVHDLDADELIGAVASSPVPVLAALGHANDDLVVARVADAAFPTPTALGAWLRETVEQKRRLMRRAEEAQLLAPSEELLMELRRLRSALKSLAWWRGAALVLAVLVTGVVVWALAMR